MSRLIGLVQNLTEGRWAPELGADAPAVVPKARLRRDGAGGRMPGPRATRARGNRSNATRLFVDAVLWLARTAAPWRDLPSELGHWKSVYTRFRRWSQAGVWENLFNALTARLSEGGVERFGGDHAKYRREGVMRRDRMLELQEVPEDVSFCTPEGGHLHAAGGAAQTRGKSWRRSVA